MTPKSIDWTRWLGKNEDLAPELPVRSRSLRPMAPVLAFRKRHVYRPVRAPNDIDAERHRIATCRRRVVGAGGIYMEYDGRDVPDVATVVADFRRRRSKGLVTATMCNQESRINQLIRGHFGTFKFGNGEGFDGFDFVAERPQVTHVRGYVDERITTEPVKDTTKAHFSNWLDAMEAGEPMMCNNPPDLGAAAIAVVILGAQSYRNGEVYFINKEDRTITTKDPGWAKQWEKLSAARAEPRHIPGWKAGDFGSKLVEPEYMKEAGPWIDGKDPAQG